VNLAILHYHLNRGGVTRVIENHLLALEAVLDPARPWPVAVLSGGRRQDWSEDLPERLRTIRLSLVDVPRLDYDAQQPADHAGDVESLYADVRAALVGLAFAPRETVLFVHNHSLGKSRALPAVLGRLAADGFALVLEIHDFAEDFRPDNYRGLKAGEALAGPGMVYPQAPHVHYAALNRRDERILADAGIAPGQLHGLPNPVPPVDRLPDRQAARAKLASRLDVGLAQRYLLYPVRCIRRKNVGEALLLSALAPPGTVVGLTLAPLNPAELPVYQRWRDEAARLGLPCRFEVAAPGCLSFPENVAASDATITTSVAEGFGMVMLEAWLAGRPLLGRDLPEVTADFTGHGLRLPWLAERLAVPLEWVGREAFRAAFRQGVCRALAAYDLPEPEDLDAKIEAKTSGGLVDFGDLDEALQRDVLGRVHEDAQSRRRVLADNPRLEDALGMDVARAAAVIAQNVRVIDEHYSLVPSGRRLRGLLELAADAPRDEPLAPLPRPERILEAFLDPGRYRPVRG